MQNWNIYHIYGNGMCSKSVKFQSLLSWMFVHPILELDQIPGNPGLLFWLQKRTQKQN